MKITPRKAMTVDGLRDRLKTTMGKTHRRACPNCNGSGQVTGPISTTEVATLVGVPPHTLTRFVNGKGDLKLDRGLVLVAVLDRLDDPLSVLDDDDERDDEEADPALLNRRGLAAMQAGNVRKAASAAAAAAGIDAMNRPLVTKS